MREVGASHAGASSFGLNEMADEDTAATKLQAIQRGRVARGVAKGPAEIDDAPVPEVASDQGYQLSERPYL